MKNLIYSKKYRNVIQNLQKARQESGLTQIEVSKKIKKPQSFISKAERGKRRLDVVELEMFVKLYKKDLNDFL